jgi:octaprenyl-diphosphate synthase
MSSQHLEKIRNPVLKELKLTDDLILQQLKSDIPLIETIIKHLISSGGKRLRPLLVILFACACDYPEGTEHLELALIIEFVHTATLLHDDVVDKSDRRRGKATANAVWGNQASVLVGDFLYSRAFQILTQRSNVAVMNALSDTTNAIAEGEILQLINQHDPDINEQNYLDVIERKTAILFKSAAEIGAMIATDDKTHWQAAAQYGLNIGMAFQIVDDILDYTASDHTLGKNTGDDLADHKATLPLIYAIQQSSPTIAKKLQTALIKGDRKLMPDVVNAIKNTQSIDYCNTVVEKYLGRATEALSMLPESAYKQSLLELIAFCKQRQF